MPNQNKQSAFRMVFENNLALAPATSADNQALADCYLGLLATLNYAFPDKVSISFILNSLSRKALRGNTAAAIVGASSPHVMAIQSGRVQKNKRQGKAKGKEKGKGLKNSYPTKPKKPQPYKKERPGKRLENCHHWQRGKDIGKG
ncbi:hypothetical protein Tco_1214634 [Tanacetum coccineum]